MMTDKEIISVINNLLEKKENFTEEYFIDIIVFMWDAYFDFGMRRFCIGQNILTDNQINELMEQLPAVQENALSKYPNSIELKFWLIYIDEMTSYEQEDGGCNKNKIYNLPKSKLSDVLIGFYEHVQLSITDISRLKELKQIMDTRKHRFSSNYLLAYLQNLA